MGLGLGSGLGLGLGLGSGLRLRSGVRGQGVRGERAALQPREHREYGRCLDDREGGVDLGEG